MRSPSGFSTGGLIECHQQRRRPQRHAPDATSISRAETIGAVESCGANVYNSVPQRMSRSSHERRISSAASMPGRPSIACDGRDAGQGSHRGRSRCKRCRPAGWYLSLNFSQQQARRPFDSILRRLGHLPCVSLTWHSCRVRLVCVEFRRYMVFLSAYETAFGVLWFRALVHLRVWALLNSPS